MKNSKYILVTNKEIKKQVNKNHYFHFLNVLKDRSGELSIFIKSFATISTKPDGLYGKYDSSWSKKNIICHIKSRKTEKCPSPSPHHL